MSSDVSKSPLSISNSQNVGLYVCMYVCTSVSIFEVTQKQSKYQNNQNELIKWLGGGGVSEEVEEGLRRFRGSLKLKSRIIKQSTKIKTTLKIKTTSKMKTNSKTKLPPSTPLKKLPELFF